MPLARNLAPQSNYPKLARNFSHPDRAWNPHDGRITELGMHLTEDHALRNDAVIGIAAAPA
jgi:hypothetical protein